jgi:hypothetical protein
MPVLMGLLTTRDPAQFFLNGISRPKIYEMCTLHPLKD